MSSKGGTGHSKHAKSNGAPRRHARLTGAVLAGGLSLLALSAFSGAVIWWGQSAGARFEEAGGDSFLTSGNWRRLHGALNPFVCVFLGYLAHQHVRIGWKNRACLVSGSALLLVLAGLAATGTQLVYGGSEIDRGLVVTIHHALGLSLPVILAAHWIEAVCWVRKLEQQAAVDAGQT